jgi:Family of unknown function (DUF6152)
MAATPKMPRSRNRTNSLATLALVVAALLAQATLARAHHSVPVNFDQSKEITITGTLTEAKWINPHSRFRIDVKQDDGKTAEWLVEMGAVNTMRRAGFEIEKFVVGDTLTIIGWPGRGRDRSMLLRTAVLKDGTRLTP